MDLLTAFKISISGFFVVFLALALISFSIKILSLVIAFFEKPEVQKDTISHETTSNLEATNVAEDNGVAYGELKLFGIDEKTAAMVMAIVSDESKIPLAELQFKSIRLLEN